MVNIHALAGITLLLSTLISAAPRNTTYDDQDFARITYTNDNDWQHQPLAGYEANFYNGSRSYTYVPGASATFNFIGTGIYLQGPFANDQAKRRVVLNGEELGVFTAYADNREPCAVFWGMWNLKNANHTVVVSHNDTANKIFAMDAWVVEVDPGTTGSPASAGTYASAASHGTGGLGIIAVAILACMCQLLLNHGMI